MKLPVEIERLVTFIKVGVGNGSRDLDTCSLATHMGAYSHCFCPFWPNARSRRCATENPHQERGRDTQPHLSSQLQLLQLLQPLPLLFPSGFLSIFLLLEISQVLPVHQSINKREQAMMQLTDLHGRSRDQLPTPALTNVTRCSISTGNFTFSHSNLTSAHRCYESSLSYPARRPGLVGFRR